MKLANPNPSLPDKYTLTANLQLLLGACGSGLHLVRGRGRVRVRVRVRDRARVRVRVRVRGRGRGRVGVGVRVRIRVRRQLAASVGGLLLAQLEGVLALLGLGRLRLERGGAQHVDGEREDFSPLELDRLVRRELGR